MAAVFCSLWETKTHLFGPWLLPFIGHFRAVVLVIADSLLFLVFQSNEIWFFMKFLKVLRISGMAAVNRWAEEDNLNCWLWVSVCGHRSFVSYVNPGVFRGF
jgi:hypothetical protein